MQDLIRFAYGEDSFAGLLRYETIIQKDPGPFCLAFLLEYDTVMQNDEYNRLPIAVTLRECLAVIHDTICGFFAQFSV